MMQQIGLYQRNADDSKTTTIVKLSERFSQTKNTKNAHKKRITSFPREELHS